MHVVVVRLDSTLIASLAVLSTIPLLQDPLPVDVAGIQAMHLKYCVAERTRLLHNVPTPLHESNE